MQTPHSNAHLHEWRGQRADGMVWTVRAVWKQQNQQQHKGGQISAPHPDAQHTRPTSTTIKLQTCRNGGDREEGVDSDSSRGAVEAAATQRGADLRPHPLPPPPPTHPPRSPAHKAHQHRHKFLGRKCGFEPRGGISCNGSWWHNLFQHEALLKSASPDVIMGHGDILHCFPETYARLNAPRSTQVAEYVWS